MYVPKILGEFSYRFGSRLFFVVPRSVCRKRRVRAGSDAGFMPVGFVRGTCPTRWAALPGPISLPEAGFMNHGSPHTRIPIPNLLWMIKYSRSEHLRYFNSTVPRLFDASDSKRTIYLFTKVENVVPGILRDILSPA